MAEVEELLDDVVLNLPPATTLRARGNQRRNRRRAGAVAAVVAAIVAGTSWAALPGDGSLPARPEKTPTASPSIEGDYSPYKKGDTLELRTAEQLPWNGTWHWQTQDVPSNDTDASLSRVMVCDGWAGSDKYSGWRYTFEYKGSRDAVAWQRYADLDGTGTVDALLKDLHETLSTCGLKPTGTAPNTYVGTGEDGRDRRVSIEHGKQWILVVEVRAGRPARG
jgi:hypothetical protein